jgi:hypothetical protein
MAQPHDRRRHDRRRRDDEDDGPPVGFSDHVPSFLLRPVILKPRKETREPATSEE